MTDAPRGSGPVRVAVIGAGFISDYHLVGLRAAGADVVTICSRTIGRAEEKARAFGIPDHTADYPGVLARDDVEAVIIATPDFTHEEYAVGALRAGKAVLLQKPMAGTSQECRRILAVAQASGVLLCVSWMHRYFDEVVRLRGLLAEGALGQVYSIRQRNATPGADWAGWFYSRQKVGGGAVVQLGVHGIDLVRYLFGEIVAVSAVTALMMPERRLKDGSVILADNEDTAFCHYRLASGALAVHEIVYNEVAGTDRFRLEVYGSTGVAWVRSERGPLALYAPAHLKREGWVDMEVPVSSASLGAAHHRHFLAMVRGEEPRDSSGTDGLAAALIVEAIYRSSESGAWEDVQWS